MGCPSGSSLSQKQTYDGMPELTERLIEMEWRASGDQAAGALSEWGEGLNGRQCDNRVGRKGGCCGRFGEEGVF